MKKDEFQEIFDNVEDYVTSSGLSLRISKQKLISKILTISKEDAIKLTLAHQFMLKMKQRKFIKN